MSKLQIAAVTVLVILAVLALLLFAGLGIPTPALIAILLACVLGLAAGLVL